MLGENCGGLNNYSRTNGDCLNYDSRLNGQVNHVSVVIKWLITFLSCDGLYIGGEASSLVHIVSSPPRTLVLRRLSLPHPVADVPSASGEQDLRSPRLLVSLHGVGDV